ncbi:hypothetical protein F4820DRAFT_225328 [Hypoxylon rubiginosum]|uniref:Uncharacterized protein n=1 Tax=Hypoxylon rubiginosum TaxID=110542 RepID=A0ACB9Z5R7_9PEZI|nr:hypothetical protein F4820DRAFT_225328 [Hypoxylon rubiginosum]
MTFAQKKNTHIERFLATRGRSLLCHSRQRWFSSIGGGGVLLGTVFFILLHGRDIRVTENLNTKQRNRVGYSGVLFVFSELTARDGSWLRARCFGAANTGLMFMLFFATIFLSLYYGFEGTRIYRSHFFRIIPPAKVPSNGSSASITRCRGDCWETKNISVCIGNHIG